MRSPIFVLIGAILLASCSTRIRYDDPKSGCNSQQLNLNSATEKELIELPGVGGPTAKLILEFRSTNGGFRRPEQILLIRGMSENRFLEFRPLVCAE
ncbi:MAG TPA: helix-hairpin-helix domain-containing protein [Pyrinomonadaceae bacterium]|nr:helix-hairpin-helix domain-containing protein [Pyrinomonadaceae bacterium]